MLKDYKESIKKYQHDLKTEKDPAKIKFINNNIKYAFDRIKRLSKIDINKLTVDDASNIMLGK